MKRRRLSRVAPAVLLAAFSMGATAQDFGSVSSGKRLPDVATSTTSTPAEVPAPIQPAAPVTTEPPPFSSRSAPAPAAGSVPAIAPAAAEPNPFMSAPVAGAAPVAPATGAVEPNPFMSPAGQGDAGGTAAVPTTVPFGGSHADAVASSPRIPESADRVLVKKSERRLYLLRSDRVIADYPIKLGLSPRGPKQREGDYRTPEGFYQIASRNAHSDFFLSLEVSYPNESDLERAKELGVRPGGLIMIHGQPNTPRKPPDWYASNDWTDGCIAVSNSDMVDIWLRTAVGVPIEIRP